MKNLKIEYLLIVIIAIISIGIAVLYEKLILDITDSGLWVLVALFFIITAFFIIRSLSRRGSDPYEIINPLLITLALYSMMLPLNYLVNVRIFKTEVAFRYITNPVMFQYIVICLIGLIGLLLGYYSPFTKQFVSKLPIPTVTYRELTIAAFVLFLYGIISFATNVASFGGISGYIELGYSTQRYVVGREAVAFGSGLELLGVSTVVLMFVTIRKKKYVPFIVFSLIFLFITLIILSIGHRRYLVITLLMAFIFFNYAIYRVKPRWILVTGFLGYVFFFAYAHTRVLWANLGVLKGFVETFKLAIEYPNLLLPFATGDFIPPAGALTEVLSDSAFKFKFGINYLTGLILLLPRVGKIWPETLQTLMRWRMETYYPGVSKHGIGFAFFTVAEGYVNFGHLGVLLHMFFYGFIARLVFLYHRHNRAKTFSLLVYATVYGIILFKGIRNEIGQALWAVTHTFLGPLLLIILFLKITSFVISKNKV